MTDNLNKFGKEIADYINGTAYTYSFNSVGNLFIVDKNPTFNQTFLSINTDSFNYDYDKYKQINDLKFVDFKIKEPEHIVIDDSNNDEDIDDNKNVTDDKLITIDSNEYSELKSDLSAAKDIIIDYRIKNGEGNNINDFEDVFPYLPKNS